MELIREVVVGSAVWGKGYVWKMNRVHATHTAQQNNKITFTHLVTGRQQWKEEREGRVDRKDEEKQ